MAIGFSVGVFLITKSSEPWPPVHSNNVAQKPNFNMLIKTRTYLEGEIAIRTKMLKKS